MERLISYNQAVKEATEQEMDRDDSVIVLQRHVHVNCHMLCSRQIFLLDSLLVAAMLPKITATHKIASSGRQYCRNLGAKMASNSTNTIPVTPTIFAALGAPQKPAIAPEDMLPRAKA